MTPKRNACVLIAVLLLSINVSCKPQEKELREESIRPTRTAIALFSKAFIKGERLSEAEITTLENIFTKDGFSNIPGGFDYAGNTKWVLDRYRIDTDGRSGREIVAAFLNKIANIVSVSVVNGHTMTEKDWFVDEEKSGITIEDYIGAQKEKQPRSDYPSEVEKDFIDDGFSMKDRLIFANDPFGDDESFMFVVTRVGRHWKIGRMALVG